MVVRVLSGPAPPTLHVLSDSDVLSQTEIQPEITELRVRSLSEVNFMSKYQNPIMRDKTAQSHLLPPLLYYHKGHLIEIRNYHHIARKLFRVVMKGLQPRKSAEFVE